VEGTSGRHEPSAFTSRWSRRPWRLLHVGDDRETLERARAIDGRAKALPTSDGRGRRDRGVRGLVDSRRRGKKTPTLLSPYTGNGARGGQAKTGSACLATIRRSVLECRENTRSPGQAQEPKSLVPSTRRKSRSESGTHEVRVHVDQSGGRSRSDASCALPTSQSQDGVVEPAGC